jgi:hypothetical protein
MFLLDYYLTMPKIILQDNYKMIFCLAIEINPIGFYCFYRIAASCSLCKRLRMDRGYKGIRRLNYEPSL